MLVQAKSKIQILPFLTVRGYRAGYESMHMIRKGQVESVGKKDIVAQKKFINDLFGIAA